jgi:hypothetical protein
MTASMIFDSISVHRFATIHHSTNDSQPIVHTYQYFAAHCNEAEITSSGVMGTSTRRHGRASQLVLELRARYLTLTGE